jgi:pyruvate dehydrogenase E1 component alpha subunit
MHIEERQNNFEISRFAESNGIKNFQVDGNDLLQVMDVAKEAIGYIRSERRPAFIEAHTYRIFSHVGFDEDLEVGNHRLSDLEIWKKRDPIDILRFEIESMVENKINWDEIDSSVDSQVENCWQIAKSAEYPLKSELFSGVYAGKI